jgi:integrase
MARKGIYKRGDFWWIRYADLTGKIIRKSTLSKKLCDAETMLLKEKKAARECKMPDTVKIENHAFSELAEKYKAWVQGRQACAELKGYVIDRLVKRYCSIPLRRFNTALVEQLQTDLMSRGLKEKKPKPTSPGYINRVLNILRHMFTKAVEWEMVEAEVLKRVRRVKQLRENKRLRFLSIEEAQGLISVCDEHLKPIVTTALNTGMRKAEILMLRWDQVDLQHGFILLDKTKNGERREIPINDTLKTVFHSLRRRIDVPHVFYDQKTLRPYQNVKRSFVTALGRAKITDFHFHDLRHTFASQLVMAGVDLAAVKELLGHKDIKMTLRYAHLAPAHKRKAVEVMGNLLSNPTEQHTPKKLKVKSMLLL